MNFNFAGFVVTFVLTVMAYLVIGFTMGFFASLLIAVAIAGGIVLYWTAQQKIASQRVQMALFAGAYYRMEVA